jgi:hypothetical protein
MFLIYINKIGKNWKDEFLYEFIFSDTIENIDGEDWDSYPASGNPSPPDQKFIKKVGTLTTTLNLEVIQNSESFAIWDAVDGIISLSWENLDGYEEYPESRLFFKFGETINSVEDKIYERDMILIFNEKNEKKGNKTQRV